MRKLSTIVLIASLLGAVALIVVDAVSSPDIGALAFAGAAGLIAVIPAHLYFKYCSPKLRRIILATLATLCGISTLAVSLLSLWGITQAWTTWREDSQWFIAGIALFASLTAFLWTEFLRTRGERVQDT